LDAVDAMLSKPPYAELTDLSIAQYGINNYERSLTARPWWDVEKKFPIGTEVGGTVVNVKEFGVFVELDPGVTGLIPGSKLPHGYANLEHFGIGERVVVKPLNINGIERRMALQFVKAAEEVDVQQNVPLGI
jgi:ribosomal protein S1